MKSHRPLCVFCYIAGLSLAALVAVAARGAESLPEGLKVVSVTAQPEAIDLTHEFDYRQIVITGALESGETVDLTRMAQLQGEPQFVTVSAMGLVRPVTDGEESLVYTFGEHSVAIAARVAGLEQPHEISFIRDIQPALSRTGCNAGTCHGSKDGKNGFKLSLRGYDAEYDYRALTDDIGARRFNRVAPGQSLMLLKASGEIPHVGGVRTRPGERYYQLLKKWIAGGVKYDPGSPRVAKIDVFPADPVLPRAGMTQQMQVVATYTDGSTRDVTAEAFVESGNIEIIEAEQGGLLTLLRRGEAPVLVRYEGAYAATTLIVMGDRSGFAWNDPPAFNYIDELVYDKLQRVKLLPSETCTDEEFVRRVYIDLTGLPPTLAQVEEFLADERDSRVKRDDLIDRLVGGREFVEHWTNKWADLLQVNRKFLGEEGAIALRNWIKDAVATNKPYDDFAREVLTASGSNLDNPPAAYYKVLREPAETMENTTHLFLAVRFNCNKCHDHPFERWTQDQYYHLAAYFAQVGRKEDPQYKGQKIGGSAVEGAKPLVEVIYDSGGGEVTHERTGQTAAPEFPYEHGDLAADDANRREQLAQWITSPENQYFAKSYVNRLWGYLFGPGIIEPIDDIRAGNPPTNPALLDALTEDFIASGFDMQHMLRTICKSRAYQLSIRTNEWNADDEINYSHAIPRRLPAEVLYDAIHVATGAPLNIPGAPAGFRAAQLPDVGVSVPFLDDFGRPVRESACECERSDGVVLGPVMKLVNGPTVADAIANPQSALARLAREEADDQRLVETMFLRFLARRPTEQELQLGLEAMQAGKEDFARISARLAEKEKQLDAAQPAWEAKMGAEVVWRPLDVVEMKSKLGADFEKLEDGSVFAGGKTGKDDYTIVGLTDLAAITALRIEALTDKRLPVGGPGRAKNGNFVLSELDIAVGPADKPGEEKPLGLANASADFSQQGWPVAAAIDDNPGTGWAVSPEFGKDHLAIFETSEDAGGEGTSRVVLTMIHRYQDGEHLVGRFRISVTDAPRPVAMSRLPDAVAAILAIPAAERSEPQQAQLAEFYRSQDAEYIQLKAAAGQSAGDLDNQRLVGLQDLAWALINNPSFLFNR